MRRGSPDSALVRSTASFNESNLFAASRSLRATLYETRGGVSATTTGPNATQHMNATQTARRLLSFDADSLRPTRLATSDTKTAASVWTMTMYPINDAAIGSVGYQIAKPAHSPTNVPKDDAIRKRSQRPPDSAAADPVKSAINANGSQQISKDAIGSQHCKSRLGSIITGHHHSAEPVAVRTTKSLSLHMNVPQTKGSRFTIAMWSSPLIKPSTVRLFQQRIHKSSRRELQQVSHLLAYAGEAHRQVEFLGNGDGAYPPSAARRVG